MKFKLYVCLRASLDQGPVEKVFLFQMFIWMWNCQSFSKAMLYFPEIQPTSDIYANE